MSFLTVLFLTIGAACLLGWWLLRKHDGQQLQAPDFVAVEPTFSAPSFRTGELPAASARREHDEPFSKLIHGSNDDLQSDDIPAFLRRANAQQDESYRRRRILDAFAEAKPLPIDERRRQLSERLDEIAAETLPLAAPATAPPPKSEDDQAVAAEYSVEGIPIAAEQAPPDENEKLFPELAAPSSRPVAAAARASGSERSKETESKPSDPLITDHPLGRIYFDPPISMTEGEVTDMFALIVAPSHVSMVSFASVTSSKRIPETATVAAPGLMYARVFADPVALQVIALGNDLVNVQSQLGYGQWQWQVRALQPGSHKMTLRISHARPILGGGGVYAEDVVALNRDILISVSKKRVARAWLLSAAGVFVGAAVGQMVEVATPSIRDTAYGFFDAAPNSNDAGTTSNPLAPSKLASPPNP